jgi:hypothetical protein
MRTLPCFFSGRALLCLALALPASLLATQVAPPVRASKGGALVYAVNDRGDRVPDFSHAGYLGGGTALPVIPARVRVSPVEGDDGARIQIAIDYVSSLTPDAHGFRGAVQLDAGRYEIGGQLRISTSGVILRGAGTAENATVLIATGTDRRALISVAGKNDRTASGPALLVTDEYVPVGANRVHVNDARGLQPGTRVLIERPSPAAWIERLNLQAAPARTPFQWRPGKLNVIWERAVVSVSRDEIVLDAPLTTSLEKVLGGATLTPVAWPGLIEKVGVENLRCESTFDAANPLKDEQHSWEAVHLDSVRDAWVRDLTAVHFAGSAVYLDANAERVTVQDCVSLSPVSEIGGYRRHTFHTSGQLTLFLRCRAEDGINDFTVGYLTAGPNAFVECRAERAGGFSGGIGSWASGVLFDNVVIDGGELRLDNLESFNQGVAWAVVNSVIWEASAGRFVVRTPPGANNWAVAVWGLYTGDGAWAKTSEFADPSSLYRAQLAERLGPSSLTALEPAKYPKISDASAPDLAKVVPDLAQQLATRSAPVAPAHPLALTNGWLASNGTLLVGRTYVTAWWRGRLEPSRAAELGPAISRFVPGRSGTGLTDDLDDLTDAMIANGQVAFRHHYGLWYDRRRDDHQMNKRPDADAWPPFFEQPFLLSGQGEAWNRLSRYDLTRYNPWYFGRLRRFAELGAAKGLVLIDEMYFQHNIIESGAHWVDCPWRPVNNINDTGFTEPPPFTGDTIKMADEFYDTTNPVREPLHRAFIRQCLANLADEPNVIHTISEEYTGPLHFMQYWLDVAGEWMRETGKHPLLALSATKDVQDAILADPARAKLVSVIDLKYWWRQPNGTDYAPKGGLNLAPRQHWRIGKPVNPNPVSVASMVREYRTKFPDKAIIAELDGADGWAFVAAGGSLPKLPSSTDQRLLSALSAMKPVPMAADVYAIGDPKTGYLIYLPEGGRAELDLSAAQGAFSVRAVTLANGSVGEPSGTVTGGKTVALTAPAGHPAVRWLSRP